MFSSALKKFNKLRKNKYKSEEFNLSSYELFELIISNNYKKGNFYLFEFPKQLILLLLSLYTILKVKIKKIEKVNYFIAFNEEIYDPRSANYISIMKQEKFLNIIRTNSIKISLKAFIKYENIFFHQSVLYFSRFFLIEKYSSFENKFSSIHKCNLVKNRIYFYLFKYLNIKKFIMLDDYREIQNFVSVCKKLKIESIGFMHSRFSKFRVSLRYDYFNKYVVWSDYFKKKLIQINPKYRNRIIVNNFRNFKRISKRKKNKQLKVLFCSDTLMDYKSVIIYLDQLKKENLKILVRLKSNQNENSNFLRYINENNFINANEKNIETAVKKHNPNFFLATNSNVLLEATLYNCYPVILKTKNDYSFDLIRDQVVISYSGKKNFHKFLKNLEAKKYLINKIYYKIWSSKSYSRNLKELF